MSLINDVLRDLDARRSERESEGDPLAGLRAPARPRPRRRRGGIAPLALAIASGAALLVGVPREPEPAELPAVAAEAPREVEAAAVAAPLVLTEPVATVSPPAPRAEPSEAAPVPEPRSAGTAPEPRAEARRAYREALERAARGESARAQLERSVALDPAHRDARAALATLLARSGDPDDATAALALLAEGRRIAAEPGAFALLEARIRAERGEVEAALALLEADSTPLPRGAAAHTLRAALHQRSGRHREAAQLYSDLLARVGSRGVWWMGLAISREAEGRPGEALSAYRAAQRSPAGPGALDPATRHWVATRIARLVRSGGGLGAVPASPEP